MNNRYGYQMANVIEKRRPIIVAVDSTATSDSTAYTVDIPGGTVRDVVGIELIKAVVPNPDNDNYLVLKLKGFDNYKGNTSTLYDGFCILERTSESSTPLTYRRDGDYHNMAYTYCFPTPRKIGQIQVEFFRPNGSKPDFLTNPHLLVFEVHTLNQPALPRW